MKRRVNYYTDERNDDFSGMEIKREPLPDGYKYIRRGVFIRLLSFVLYRLIAFPVAWLYCKLRHGVRIRNKKALRSSRGKGIFVYANHTLSAGDAFFPSLVAFPRRTYIVTGTESVNVRIAGKLTPLLGALPLPSRIAGHRDFTAALKTRISEKACVYIYPEAHIWPYHTGIRDFPDPSFLYPVLSDAPVYAATTVFRRRVLRRRPKCEVYVDGPFYPDPALSAAENRSALRDKVYCAMKERSRLSDCEYIKYERADNAGEGELRCEKRLTTEDRAVIIYQTEDAENGCEASVQRAGES